MKDSPSRLGREKDGFRSYGWPATLELLSPPSDEVPSSRQVIRMIICPSCSGVHEEKGLCISRHADMSPLVCHPPATAIGNSNPLELNARTVQHAEIPPCKRINKERSFQGCA